MPRFAAWISAAQKGSTVSCRPAPARVQGSPETHHAGERSVATVRYRLLTRDSRYGTVEIDETRVARNQREFNGRVEEMLVNAIGAETRKVSLVRNTTPEQYWPRAYDYMQSTRIQTKAAADPKTPPPR